MRFFKRSILFSLRCQGIKNNFRFFTNKYFNSSDGSESRLGIDSTLTRHFLADSYSIGLDFLRLGLARTQPITTTDGSKSRLGIDSTLTRHFLADSYSILLEESRLGLDRAWLFKTRTRSDSTFSDSTHH